MIRLSRTRSARTTWSPKVRYTSKPRATKVFFSSLGVGVIGEVASGRDVPLDLDGLPSLAVIRRDPSHAHEIDPGNVLVSIGKRQGPPRQSNGAGAPGAKAPRSRPRPGRARGHREAWGSLRFFHTLPPRRGVCRRRVEAAADHVIVKCDSPEPAAAVAHADRTARPTARRRRSTP